MLKLAMDLPKSKNIAAYVFYKTYIAYSTMYTISSSTLIQESITLQNWRKVVLLSDSLKTPRGNRTLILWFVAI